MHGVMTFFQDRDMCQDTDVKARDELRYFKSSLTQDETRDII